MLFSHFETQAIRSQTPRSQNREHSAPLYLSSGFVFDNAEALRAAFAEETDPYIYSRHSNPNTSELVEKMCLLEGAEDGLSTASGMAAIYTSLAALLNSGDHVIACASVFGATHTIFTRYFPKWGITHSYFPASDPSQLIAMIRPTTKLLYVETPTNPGIEVLDLELLATIARQHGLLLVVDNCFATPYLQRPLQWGADLVLHSATKYIDGQGRVLGGLVLGRRELIREIYLFARITGPTLSAFNAWMLSKSLETLSLRMEKHCDNALKIATALEQHEGLEALRYPFLPSHPQHHLAKKQMRLGGGVLTFSVRGGYTAACEFMDQLQMTCISPNLGDSRTLATHPASSTHAKLTEEERLTVGILPGTIRLSVGLEHPQDILDDLLQALR